MDGTRVVIVEDEPIIAADLSNQLTKAGLTILDVFEDGAGILAFLKSEIPDIIIMDIHLFGDLDGVDVANQVNKNYSIPIIFLTSNTDSATFNRAKLTYPHAFLSKPFRIKDILHSLDLALEEVNNHELEFLDDRIFIKHKDSLEKVLYQNILYAKAEGAYTNIVTKEKQYTISQTLKKIEEKINVKYFFKAHRSYVINMRNVDRVTESYVYIMGKKIPVSRSRKEELLQLFKTL